MKIYIKRISNDEVVKTIDVTGKSERHIGRCVAGILINMDTDNFYIDDSETEQEATSGTDK